MAKRDRRSEIMKATEKLFASRRFHEITLDEVIREAHVGKGTVYRYFKDKDDLFFETAMNGYAELCGLLRDVPGDLSFEEQLLAACTQISAFFRRRRPLFRMMHSEDARAYWHKGEFRQRWRERRRKIDAAMSDILRRGVEEGALRTDVRPETLSRLLLGLLRTYSRARARGRSRDLDLDLVVDMFLRGAGARGSETQKGSGS
ncbi:MAG: TetR/AcrR family transcriptional regulator [Planctomycetota bacterium]